MEACLTLARIKCNLNKQQQKDLKLKDQQQKQHRLLQQHKQETQAIITNQNYYTTQQQPQNLRHLVAHGQTTNVMALNTGLQYNEKSHLVRQQLQQNMQHNAPQTHCTATPQYRNTSTATSTTTANMQKPSLSTANNSTVDVGSSIQQQPQPQTTSFQKNTVTVEVTPTLSSTVSPTNTPRVVTQTNVQTLHKINSQLQQQQHQQQQHQYHHLLHQQQQQQLEADLDAIEVYVDPEPHVSFKGGGGLLRQTKTLGRLNHQHQHHHSIEDQHGQWTNTSQITSLQLLQLQQQQQHDYSYAYYEPGAVMKHTNIPHAELMAAANEEEDLIPPPPNSIRALLLKGKKNKLLVSPTIRESYQIRLTQQQSHNVAGATVSTNCSNVSTPENFYEEISAASTSSSSNSMTSTYQPGDSSHLAGSLTRTLVVEELRRVQNRHHKILGELNLSVEAMLMPDSPRSSSPTDDKPPTPAVSVTTASGQPLRLTSSSADNICDTALAGGPADNFISPIPNSATVSAAVLQSSHLAADLDSGFSGSSGASYIGSLRLYKTKALTSSRSNNLSSTTSAATGSNADAKSQQSAFAYATQSRRSFERASSHNTNTTSTSASASSSSAVLATTSPRSIKHLLQIHQNKKQRQQDHHLHQQHQHHLHQQQHQQQHHQHSQHINDDLLNSSGFFTRASCGCRLLNCAKIRAAEDPSPVVLNAQPNVSKGRSFWNRKGWRKLLGFSTSSSCVNNPG